MKTSTSLRLLAVLGLAALAGAPLPAADGGDGATTSIAFSKPGAPRALHVNLMWGDVRIVGADVDQVTVRSDTAPANGPARRPDGLRVIASSSSFELTERDNTVTLSQDGAAPGGDSADFEITVPRNIAISLKIAVHGDASIKGVTGDIEVSNLNGSIELADVVGGVTADSMNGEITARYATLSAGKAHAFSSMNGEIVLFVPAAAQATFKLRAQNGTVATDLDEKVFVTRTEGRGLAGHAGAEAARFAAEAARAGMEAAREAIEMAHELEAPEAPEAEPAAPGAKAPKAPKAPRVPKVPRAPTFPAFGGQVVTGQLNGGGVEVRATTMNGEIQIRAGQS